MAIERDLDTGVETLSGADAGRWQEQLESLHAISVRIAGLRQPDQVMDRALDYCLQLTESKFGFVGLIDEGNNLDVAAIKGFAPDRPEFYERFRRIPIRPSVFGIVVIEARPHRSNDVANDPYHIGSPRGHPPVQTFLGVPLTVGTETIGMIGVANRAAGYDAEHERLLSTFANQVAVAIANARLYERQGAMIADLQALHARLDAAKLEAMLHEERNRIAEELHDRVAQIMFSIGIGASWCLEQTSAESKVLSAESTADHASFSALSTQHSALLIQALEQIRDLAGRGTAEIRRAVYNLATDVPQSRGLVDELREAVATFDSTSDLHVDLFVDGRPRHLPYEVEEALHRIALEALTNVQRHAGASVAIVSLGFEPEQVTLVVQDNGMGIPPLFLDGHGERPGHFGLKGMQRRTEAIGGTFALHNGEDGGLVVRATVRTKVLSVE